MNRSIANGKWQQFTGALAVRWGALTGDRLRVIHGRHRQMTGGLHVAYGMTQYALGKEMDGIQRRSRHAGPNRPPPAKDLLQKEVR